MSVNNTFNKLRRTDVKRRILCLMLAFAMLFALCSCGGSGRYKEVKTLGEQEYSIAFRNGDSTYHYVDRALRQLSYDGDIDVLEEKWFGGSEVSFPKDRDAMADIGYVEQRSFTIGVDLDSYPMCFESGSGYDGFDVELAGKVCEKLGWQLKIQPIRSEDTFIELNSGNIDCAWGGVMLDPDSTDYTVLVTYMSVDMVIAGRSGESGSLGGKTMIMGTSQYYLELMEENDRASSRLGQIARQNGTMQDYFRALDSGECDFILTTDAAVDYANRR